MFTMLGSGRARRKGYENIKKKEREKYIPNRQKKKYDERMTHKSKKERG